MARVSFKKGSQARKARKRVAEQLKKRGIKGPGVFAQATAIVKRASKKGRGRLARHGLSR